MGSLRSNGKVKVIFPFGIRRKEELKHLPGKNAAASTSGFAGDLKGDFDLFLRERETESRRHRRYHSGFGHHRLTMELPVLQR